MPSETLHRDSPRSRPATHLLASVLLGGLLSGHVWAAQHGGAAHSHPNKTCSEAALPNLNCARSPTPAFAPDGRLWIVWYSRGHIYLQHSSDQGAHFSPPQVINRSPEDVDDQGEDRPQLAFGPQGEIYLLWTRKLERPYTGHIRFSRSLDNGQSFSEPVNINDDGAVIAHRFPTLQVNAAGQIFVAWIDKRDREAAVAAGKTYPGAALYYAASDDKGLTFPNQRLAHASCECCRIAMSLDSKGLPILLYRQILPGSIRDHALLRFDSLRQPRTPERVSDDNWKLDGCPHHGPALASTGDVQHLAWFTAGATRQGLFYARADAKGISPPLAFGQPKAEHPAVMAQGEQVYLVWRIFSANQTHIFAQTSADGGRTWGPARSIASTADASDHPLLVNQGPQPFLSWQTAKEGYRLLPIANGENAE